MRENQNLKFVSVIDVNFAAGPGVICANSVFADSVLEI